MKAQNAQAMHELGGALGELLQPGDFVGLNGTLGTGKTVFSQGVARGLGVPDLGAVGSPTYTLVNEYPGGRVPLVHMDFYRLERESDLYEIGFYDYLAQECALVVEWAERFRDACPSSALVIELVQTGETSRALTASAFGTRGEALLGAWRAKAV